MILLKQLKLLASCDHTTRLY